MIPSNQFEQLYMQRDGAQSICIDLPIPLPQHQLDGIRFLLRQYKKRTPGVILNDPSGYGKQLQIVLFLNALRPILKKPILVLSKSVDDWKDQFEKWTNCSVDIAVESPNPYTAKQICINPVKDGLAFSRRSWSIVVVHDEETTKELLKINFNADYKIWVTACDLKEDLHALASIYEWLHPNQTFDVGMFTAKKNNWRDVVEKTLLLDAFLEDFLIRRTDFLMLFDKPKNHAPIKPSPVKATRKNKDPTGTKVKRSKRRIIEDDEDDNITNVNESTVSNETILTSKKVTEDIPVDVPGINDLDNNMDVERFIRNEKAIQSEGFNLLNSNDTFQESITMNVSESMEIDFRSAVKEILEHENSVHIGDEYLQNGHVDPENDVEKTDNNIAQQFKDRTKNTDVVENTNNIIVPATEEPQNTLDDHDEVNQHTKKGIVVPETESENTHDLSNNHQRFDAEKSEEHQSNDWKIEDNKQTKNVKLVSKDDAKTIIGDGYNGGASNDNKNFKTNELVKKKSKIEEFDAELAEIEANALKKLKGSILDSLF